MTIAEFVAAKPQAVTALFDNGFVRITDDEEGQITEIKLLDEDDFVGADIIAPLRDEFDVSGVEINEDGNLVVTWTPDTPTVFAPN